MTTEKQRLRCPDCKDGAEMVEDKRFGTVLQQCKTCKGTGELLTAPIGVASSEFVRPRPTPWPKPGDRIRHEASGKEGDVLSNENGTVKIDWGLYITEIQASELEHIQ